jgi:hypothetical protein
MRHVKLTHDVKPDVAALSRLIDSAYTDIKARLAADPRSPRELPDAQA